MITPFDACLMLSNSGETAELADVIAHSRRFSIPMVSITRAAGSTLARQSEVAIILPNAPEACRVGMAPTTSTTCMIALGDAMAVTLMQLRGFCKDQFLSFHPGGKLGAQLLKVNDLMHTGDNLPVVSSAAPMGDALVAMTAKGFGVATIVDSGRLVGIITDGDLRRNLDGLMDKTAGDVCTRTPRVIRPDGLASEALGMMNKMKISALCVVDENHQLCGLLHIHDCLRFGVM
jgi:arabinose-5-phosphate isomerase